MYRPNCEVSLLGAQYNHKKMNVHLNVDIYHSEDRYGAIQRRNSLHVTQV
jgi:hypothetical protein